MNRLFFIFLVIITLVFSGCSLDSQESNFYFEPLSIVNVAMPDSLELNQSNQIQVTYQLPNACTGFSGFDIKQQNDSIINVVVFGTARIDVENCAQTITEKQETFDFICKYNQTYTFRFWQGVDENDEHQYLEIEVPVN